MANMAVMTKAKMATTDVVFAAKYEAVDYESAVFLP